MPTKPRTRVTSVMRAFLFSDLRGYTAFVERNGDAAAAKLLRDYRTLVRREVARHEGAEVKTEGDSFYVVFDRPSAALGCAVAIQRRAAGRDDLHIGMGLHTGEVVPHDEQYVGSAVNIAARLASKAEAGEIVISDTMRSLVRTATDHAMTDRGPLKLKGVTERVRGWRVDWSGTHAAADAVPATNAANAGDQVAPAVPAPPAPPLAAPAPAGQLLCPAMVGRETELAQIVATLERATEGAGATVIVGGEAGLGKSALAREAHLRAGARGFRLLVGVTHESSAGLPYGPFVAAIRSGFRGLERDRLGRFLQQVAPALAQLFPELERSGARPDAAGVERHKLSMAFQEVFRAFAREGPVLVTLEDLHWADEASLELLHDLTRELRDTRLVILATYRNDEMHRRHPFLRTLAGLQRERLASVIQLRRLTRDEVGELIRLTFQHPRAITPEFLDAIYARCDGNPYFSEELLKVLVESGEIHFDQATGEWTRGGRPVEEMRIPESIVEAVRARVDRLSPEARRTVESAAVVGLRVPFRTLVAVRGLPETEIEPHLRELIEQQLLAEQGRDEDAYSFRHALTREVVYDDLLVSERKRLHRAVAEALANSAGPEPALIAHHLLAAGDATGAVPHLMSAGDAALAAGAARDAAAHYERALTIGLSERDHIAALERLAGAYMRFDGRRALSIAEDAARRARAAGDRRALSRALQMQAFELFNQSEGAKRDEATRQAIEAVADDESVELARATVQSASWRSLDADASVAIALADQALTMGERLGDRFTIGRAMAVKGLAVGWTDPEEGLPLVLRARDILLEAGAPEMALSAHNNAVAFMTQLERPAGERAAFIDAGIALGRQHGIEIPAFLGGFKAEGLFQSGEWDAAMALRSLINEGWRANLEAQIERARAGPHVALPSLLKVAERDVRHAATYTMVHGHIWRAAALSDVGDVAGASAALDALETVCAERAGLRHLAGKTANVQLLCAAALRCERPEWIDAVERSAATQRERPRERARTVAAAARAILTGDADTAARHLEQRHADALHAGWEHDALANALDVARDARRRGLPLTASWASLFAACRSFAMRANATWWIQVLDELEAS